jgi:N4-gp56 family major capsid protein
MANENLNTTGTLSAQMQTFNDRTLLEFAKTKWVYAKYGQKKPIPRNSGKVVSFRRFTPFDPTPANLELGEGVTPDGQSLAQTTVTATVKQYGAYTTITDLLDLTALDDNVAASLELIGEQLGTCADWIARDAMVSGASDIMTLVEIRKAVRTLTKAKARKFNNGADFICIISPDQKYDLFTDTFWQAIATHADPSRAYDGEIGRCFGVAFVESTEALVDQQSVANQVNATTDTVTTFVLKTTPSAAGVAYLSTAGNKLKIGENVAGATEYTIASYNAATKTVTLSAAASLTANHYVYSEDAGAPNATTGVAPNVHHALMFGSDAYGIVDIDNSSAMKSYVNQPIDPLRQKWTVAGKILAYAVKVLNSTWILDIQTGATA